MTMHALIIDDQEYNIEVLGRLLALQGMTYSALTSQRDVVPTIHSLESISVVFLDLEVPYGVSYLEMLKLLREQPSLEGVPIVAYTVHTGMINEIQQAGFDHFLGKPLSIKKFPEQLSRILNSEPVWEY